MNPRIEKILDVKPFSVKLKWTNGQIRTVDFNEFLAEERGRHHPLYSKLFDKEIFMKVKTDGRTLFWEDLTEMMDENGMAFSAPLDFCPDVLYNNARET